MIQVIDIVAAPIETKGDKSQEDNCRNALKAWSYKINIHTIQVGQL